MGLYFLGGCGNQAFLQWPHHFNVIWLGFILQQKVDSSSFWHYMKICYPPSSSQQVHLIALHPYRADEWIVAELHCMSGSRPTPVTSGKIHIPAPPLIYLAHLVLYSSGQDLIAHPPSPTNQMWLVAGSHATIWLWHSDAGAVDKAGLVWMLRTETSVNFLGSAIHLKVRDEPHCCQVKVNLIGLQRRRKSRRWWAVLEGGRWSLFLACQWAL